MEDYELFPSCNILRVDEKGEENECPKEYREVEKGKAITAEDEGKNIQYEPRKRKDSIVRLCKKKMLCRTIDIVERCQQQGKQMAQSAQETKRRA